MQGAKLATNRSTDQPAASSIEPTLLHPAPDEISSALRGVDKSRGDGMVNTCSCWGTSHHTLPQGQHTHRHSILLRLLEQPVAARHGVKGGALCWAALSVCVEEEGRKLSLISHCSMLGGWRAGAVLSSPQRAANRQPLQGRPRRKRAAARPLTWCTKGRG